eukprot:gene1565-3026_t
MEFIETRRQNIIIDCDPGLDDAVALLLAFASPELNILGITATAGNVSVRKTQYNARRLCEVADKSDLKVFAGCPRSILRRYSARDNRNPEEDFLTPMNANVMPGDIVSSPKQSNTRYNVTTSVSTLDIHGNCGLRGSNLPPPTMPLQEEHAVNFIINAIHLHPNDITLVCTGPLTNLATAIIMSPNISTKISKIVLMGGSMGMGNITPAAEYNFYADPEAARIIFSSNIPIVMFGLDVTMQAYVTPIWIEQLKLLNSKVSSTIINMLENSIKYSPVLEEGETADNEAHGQVLHDVHCIAYLLDPSLYKGRYVYVEVDTTDTITNGRTTVDWNRMLSHTHKPNAVVINRLDLDRFFSLLTDRIAKYPLC